MKRLWPALLLCSCVGSLVDHNNVPITLPDGGTGGTPLCNDSCTTSIPEAAALCVGSTCTYECNPPYLNTGTACALATSIAAGGDHTCAILTGGVVRCWGDNGQMQLGVDTTPSTSIPVGPSGLPPAAMEIAASTTQTCARLDTGAVWCWGLGAVPHVIDGITGTPGAIAVGDAHACAATPNAVFCWGDNSLGQLGSGAAHLTAAPVSGIAGASALAAGRNHTCAISGAQVICWGANDAGQCGTGGSTTTSPPQSVSGVSNAVFIAAGEGHTCAGASGTLYCWGANAQMQIDGSRADQPSAKGVFSSPAAAAAGSGHTCAIQGGSIYCMGSNSAGQLGLNNGFTDKSGMQNTGLTTADRIAAGSNHTCALFHSGALQCWGANGKGQLGNVSGNTETPVDVTGR